MNDRELLELAARACGYELWQTQSSQVLYYGKIPQHRIFNPLNDDGDALRLAVKLNLDIRFVPEVDGAAVHVIGNYDDYPEHVTPSELLESDAGEATRRAIVRAAADMQKEKEQERSDG